MSKCKKCNHDCHCNGELHSDEYGTCACTNCKCKREYTKEKVEHNWLMHREYIIGGVVGFVLGAIIF